MAKRVLRYNEEEFVTLLENIVNKVKKEERRQINENPTSTFSKMGQAGKQATKKMERNPALQNAMEEIKNESPQQKASFIMDIMADMGLDPSVMNSVKTALVQKFKK